MRAQIEWLKEQLFGGGKSEKQERAQLALTLGELEPQLAAAPAVQQVSYERTAPVARVLPAENLADLPGARNRGNHPGGSAAYERIGEERTFEVAVVPPQLVKREIVRPKFRHRTDRSRPPVVAPAPARAVAGGYASAGLLA